MTVFLLDVALTLVFNQKPMKKLKLSAVISAFLSLIIMSQPVLAAVAFTDVPSAHANYNAIIELQTKGIIGGYSDNTFKPENKINRAELTKIVIEAVYPGQAAGSNCFSDVKDEWFAKYVCFAVEKGIVSGYADSTFKPNDNINYVEALKITLGAFSYDPMVKTEVWYQAYLDVANTLGVSVSTDNNEKISRGKMAQLISNILGCLKPTKFTNKLGNFGVTFPGKPINASYPLSTADGDVTMYMFGFKNNEKAFILAYSDFPDKTIQSKSAKDLLQDEKDGALAGATTDEEKENTYKGYTGLFYKAKSPDGTQFMTAQTYLVGNRLYQMEILTSGSYPTDAEVSAFIGTFRFLK